MENEQDEEGWNDRGKVWEEKDGERNRKGGERERESRVFQRFPEGFREGRGRLGMTLRGWNSEGWPGSPAFALASCDAEHVAVRRAYVRHDYAFTPLSASILAS